MRTKHQDDKRSDPISLRLDVQLLSDAEALAKKQGRKLRNLIEHAVRLFVERESKRK